ncbi:hypothetical protein SAPIO_CDS7239 [Scedosporium apiospermum]|uniref:EamA domain-containing protein n=1 Tax=Pseudallescheria apiosperma TaxID=563466 RepID=A0A084G1E9_PSEDA|nr:uncharacterized protein SAPIO_CDS7239 [Scedosporium apiospermum]KEZ41161.1 hypothetical protein SAPIO_CDS7239 [Scedosporium apiospermum]
MVRRRNPPRPSSPSPAPAKANVQPNKMTQRDAGEQQPLLPRKPEEKAPSPASRWILLAIASGACAAFNGMFAKLRARDSMPFNGVMWSLYTSALAKGNSTTQVSIMNTSTNFMVTAILGFAVFSEALPPLWWAGAALLVAGNVILGRAENNSSSASDGKGEEPEASGEDSTGGILSGDGDGER